MNGARVNAGNAIVQASRQVERSAAAWNEVRGHAGQRVVKGEVRHRAKRFERVQVREKTADHLLRAMRELAAELFLEFFDAEPFEHGRDCLEAIEVIRIGKARRVRELKPAANRTVQRGRARFEVLGTGDRGARDRSRV